MINKKKYDLVPYHNNFLLSKKKNSLNKDVINYVKETIKKIVRYSNAVLMQECKNFEDFTGRDVDTFYLFNNQFLNIDNGEDVILNQREEGSYRFLINHREMIDFINLDVEDLAIFSPQTKNENKIHFKDAINCDKTGLKHFETKSIIYYKIVKYFSQGIVFSYEQLYKLKKILNSININDLNYILYLTSKNLPNENIWIKKLIQDDFQTFEQNENVKKFWIKKRIIRQNKRKVFAGKLELKNLFKSKKFIKAFFFGPWANWSKNHNPMPAIAIVGNDGAGKTTICDYVIKNYHKLDPAFINMKSDVPMMPHTKYLIKFIRKILEFSVIKNISLFKKIFLFIGQIVDIFDQYIKYKIGMAYADSGYGITIFERYITDKLRGEFPNKKNKFLPLEQFFPLPDGFFYLDIRPEVTLKRKDKDNHTLQEMISKRANYISLLDEFSEVKKIPCDKNIEENIKDLKNYIFELAFKKKKQFKSGLGIKRCVWKKNRKRILAGDPAERFQKGSFL
jgi:thymidylate kinase